MNALLFYLKGDEYKSHSGIQRLLRTHENKIIQLDELERTSSLSTVFAFNLNKGERISICLSNPTHQTNNMNELVFVLLHEMAHSMTAEYNHNAEFWKNFKFLIHVAEKHGLYENIDYSKTPKPFCKYKVNHNPAFDP